MKTGVRPLTSSRVPGADLHHGHIGGTVMWRLAVGVVHVQSREPFLPATTVPTVPLVIIEPGFRSQP